MLSRMYSLKVPSAYQCSNRSCLEGTCSRYILPCKHRLKVHCLSLVDTHTKYIIPYQYSEQRNTINACKVPLQSKFCHTDTNRSTLLVCGYWFKAHCTIPIQRPQKHYCLEGTCSNYIASYQLRPKKHFCLEGTHSNTLYHANTDWRNTLGLVNTDSKYIVPYQYGDPRNTTVLRAPAQITQHHPNSDPKKQYCLEGTHSKYTVPS